MPTKYQPNPRTRNNKLRKRLGIPKWVIAVVVLSVVGTGMYLVYNSFASSTADTRIGDNNGTTTLYCKRDRSKCYLQQPQPPNTISLEGFVYVNSRCSTGLEYRLLGAFKGPRQCISVYVYR